MYRSTVQPIQMNHLIISRERLRLALYRSTNLIRSWRRIMALLLQTRRLEVFESKCFAVIDIGFILGLLGIAGR